MGRIRAESGGICAARKKFVIVNRMRVRMRARVCVRAHPHARERLDCSHGIFDIERGL